MPASDDALANRFTVRISNAIQNRIKLNACALGLSKADYLRRLIAVPIGEQEAAEEPVLSVDTSETNPVYGGLVLCGYVMDFAAKALNSGCKARRSDPDGAGELVREAADHLGTAARLAPVLRKQLDGIGARRRIHFIGNYYLLLDRALSHWRQLCYACAVALDELAEDGRLSGHAESFFRARAALGELNGFRLWAAGEVERYYREDRAAYGSCVSGIPRLEGGAR